MREIKFRAWDKEDEEYITWEQLLQTRYNQDYLKDHVSKESPILSMFTDKHIELEQFTGLHDKTGKEIYEGDIISGASDLGVGIAKWNYDSWVLINHFLDSDAMLDDGEVIGNIHENPELVK